MPAHSPEECDRLLFQVVETVDLDDPLALHESEAVFVVSPGRIVSVARCS
jgi:hypothetical protein